MVGVVVWWGWCSGGVYGGSSGGSSGGQAFPAACPSPWEGGGVLRLEKVPTAARLPQSCGCCEQTLIKRRGCPVVINAHRELSNMFMLGFYIE